MSQKVYIKKAIVKKLIETHYGLPVASINEVRGVFKIMSESGVYAFKNAEELEDLDLVRSYVEHIRNNGFDRLPRIIPSASGNELIGHEGYLYYLEQWTSAKETTKDTAHLERIGSALADFHRAAKSLVPPATSHRFAWGLRPHMLLQLLGRFDKWRNEHQRGSYAGQMLDFLEYRCKWALSSLKGVSYPDLLRRAPDSAVLCHGSLHHKNILIDSQNNIWFIDLESFVYAERTLDLAGLLHYYAPSRDWDSAAVRSIVLSYQSRLAAPLLKEEWRCLLSYLAFPRRMLNGMLRYFDKPEKEQKEYLKLKKIIESDWSKEKFLGSVKL